MYDVTLICTVHEEQGACSLSELYKIIETIDPQIIFEEIPPSAFDDYYKDRTRSNLETRTISRYLESHQIDHAPVDYFDIPPSFFEDNRIMHERVQTISHEYRQLLDSHSAYARIYGFAYLNSVYCTNLHRELYGTIESALRRIDDDDLLRTFRTWNSVIEKRDLEMIRNIYKYSREHRYDKGLFLLGAAHRESIIDKLREHAVKELPQLTWNFEGYDGMTRNE